MSNEEKKAFVEKKFSSITPRYDFLNSLLSLNIDRYWRWVTARELDNYTEGPILDLCAGTLPLSLSIARRRPERHVLALDFCRDMLAYGRNRLNGQAAGRQIIPICADGEEIPCCDNTFSGITVAFGVRNLSNLDKGLKEMWRVLRPGGKLVILEFSRPKNSIMRPLYFFYLMRILPYIGGRISGDEEAYRYLATSIRQFCSPEQLAQKMEAAGYIKVDRRPLTAGIVTLYTGEKP
ncbi:MAG: ubiquinone/menaquinone biosynthesis methyltransferase [Thermodesulfobacteriota bacterium]|nr:ubiquinone/menaquinone biosynthesis methyltransferase [Thermodesulfobacteriota bacterium]